MRKESETNRIRALRGADALRVCACRPSGDVIRDSDLTNCLADLMHWARMGNRPFYRALQDAERHFHTEITRDS